MRNLNFQQSIKRCKHGLTASVNVNHRVNASIVGGTKLRQWFQVANLLMIQGLLWIELLESISLRVLYIIFLLEPLVRKHKLWQLLWYMHMPGLHSPVSYIQMKDQPLHLNKYVLNFWVPTTALIGNTSCHDYLLYKPRLSSTDHFIWHIMTFFFEGAYNDFLSYTRGKGHQIGLDGPCQASLSRPKV